MNLCTFVFLFSFGDESRLATANAKLNHEQETAVTVSSCDMPTWRGRGALMPLNSWSHKRPLLVSFSLSLALFLPIDYVMEVILSRTLQYVMCGDTLVTVGQLGPASWWPCPGRQRAGLSRCGMARACFVVGPPGRGWCPCPTLKSLLLCLKWSRQSIILVQLWLCKWRHFSNLPHCHIERNESGGKCTT